MLIPALLRATRASFSVAAGILTESALSFLGFGVSFPVPSWGSLVSETRDPSFWWIHLFPGLLIFLTVVCYNLVGDAVRDALGVLGGGDGRDVGDAPAGGVGILRTQGSGDDDGADENQREMNAHDGRGDLETRIG